MQVHAGGTEVLEWIAPVLRCFTPNVSGQLTVQEFFEQDEEK